PRRGKRDQQRAERGEDRDRRSPYERVPVQRLVDERSVLIEAERVNPRRHALAQRKYGEVQVRQHDETDEPHQRGCHEQQKREARMRCRWRRENAGHHGRAVRKAIARCGSKPNATLSPTRRSVSRPVWGNAIRTCVRVSSSRTSTAELAPSKSKLST